MDTIGHHKGDRSLKIDIHSRQCRLSRMSATGGPFKEGLRRPSRSRRTKLGGLRHLVNRGITGLVGGPLVRNVSNNFSRQAVDAFPILRIDRNIEVAQAGEPRRTVQRPSSLSVSTRIVASIATNAVPPSGLIAHMTERTRGTEAATGHVVMPTYLASP